ncbi:RNA polymerase factor sigma-54 [Arenibaculum sp.]|jgi:RNA polymerase sigma-54 factor|uniref:RNA polymerase factor sigma-54 n=1 Tax=Arenibaculum sp. TaxID=2865862 RepID=UPI002E143744|nr:RNA polymerase factor sigma-54 [Arenibaculum sp.]
MALTQRLDLRQSQSLVMTPQLQQAIKLLQLSNLELADYVDREIEQNPLLERDDGPADGGSDVPADGGDGRGGADGERERAGGGDDAGADGGEAPPPADPLRMDSATLASSEVLPADREGPLDTDYDNVWTNGSLAGDGGGDWSGRGGRTDFSDDDYGLDQVASGEASLRDHVVSQINVELGDPADRLIGLALLEQLDEAGYVAGDLDALAVQLGISAARVEAVLARLQRFDPPGIFARSLKECLAIQLREKDRLDPAMQALVDHLDLLAARNVPALLRICGVDAEDLSDMIAEIKALDPKPALRFDRHVAQTVTPDILMRPQPGGGWLIELNSDTLPRVLVNQRYFTRVVGEVRSKTERDYINERFHSANWLVKSLHQRATTILKVASEIVRQQDAFFVHGVQHLKPLILRDIAEAIGMHESTVSRVTTNKFMATPRGLFELKYFFTAAIAGADGEAAHSAEAVRHRIKTLIDAESADAVLSDDRIVEVLRVDGIDIARRTVAKYREAMRIPSSVQRRREKALRL